MADGTCRSRSCCPTARACRCPTRPPSTSSRAPGAACARWPQPALGSLARAYVRGDLDFTGSARRMLDIADSMVGVVSHGRDRARARLKALAAPAPRQPRATSRTTTTSPTRSTGCGSTSGWSIRARISAATATRSTPRRRRSSTTSAASCGWRPASASSTSAAAGARSCSTRPRHYGVDATGITLSQNQFDHVNARDRGARPRGPRARRTARLPRPARGARSTTRSRASACSSTSACGRFPQLFRQDLPRAEAGRHGAEPRHHAQRARRADSLGSGIGDFVEEYVFPGGELTHVSRVIEGMARRGPRARRCRGAARALREDAVALGRPARGATRTAARAEVGDERYRDLAHLHGGLGACVRPRLAVAVASAGRQAARRRPPAASAHARLHVQAG